MIKIEKTEVMGWEPAIRGMRNPMNSWEKGDSIFTIEVETDAIDYSSNPDGELITSYIPVTALKLGPNDHELSMNLVKGGPVHAKFRRMITVYVDVTAPLYWWKEYDTYKVGTVANSCSTMHKIHAKPFDINDFSHEHLTGSSLAVLHGIIDHLNLMRNVYISEQTKDKKYWWQLIQLLPTSYNQKRTLMLNYEVLAGIYVSRKNHKLDEWHDFCDWIERLPYSEIIVGEVNDK